MLLDIISIIVLRARSAFFLASDELFFAFDVERKKKKCNAVERTMNLIQITMYE